MFDFTGRTAVVTGAGGTLGGEVARRLAAAGARVLAVDVAAAGARVLAVDVAAAPLDAVVAEIIDAGGSGVAHVADVRDAGAVAGYADAAVALGGTIDLFFNNAGVEGTVSPIADLMIDDVRRVLDINVIGALHGLKEVLPRMRDGGAIVNTGSTAALAGASGFAAYVASKHAVLGLTRTAALEAAERSIRVNAICPGPIEGRMIESLDEQRRQVFHLPDGLVQTRVYAKPAAVADIVLFLLSDSASLITGQAILATAGD